MYVCMSRGRVNNKERERERERERVYSAILRERERERVQSCTVGQAWIERHIGGRVEAAAETCGTGGGTRGAREVALDDAVPARRVAAHVDRIVGRRTDGSVDVIELR